MCFILWSQGVNRKEALNTLKFQYSVFFIRIYNITNEELDRRTGTAIYLFLEKLDLNKWYKLLFIFCVSRIPSKTPVDQQESSPTNTISPQSKQLQETSTTSSPDSLTGTPVSGRKPKILAPWRQNKDTSPAQNVSKDNVYDFDGKFY